MKRKASKTKRPRRFAPAAGSAIPHALHWGWREVGIDGIEVFGRVQINEKLMETRALERHGGIPAAVQALAKKLRTRMARTLECDEHRIRFINNGTSEDEPRLSPNEPRAADREP